MTDTGIAQAYWYAAYKARTKEVEQLREALRGLLTDDGIHTREEKIKIARDLIDD